jgi:hypothetical protein
MIERNRLLAALLRQISEKDKQSETWFLEDSIWRSFSIALVAMIENPSLNEKLRNQAQAVLKEKEESIWEAARNSLSGPDVANTQPYLKPVSVPRVNGRALLSLIARVKETITNFKDENVRERQFQEAFRLFLNDEIDRDALFFFFLNKTDDDTLDYLVYPEPQLMGVFVRAVKEGRYQTWQKTKAWQDFLKQVKLVKKWYLEEIKSRDLLIQSNGELRIENVVMLLEKQLFPSLETQ